MMRCLAISPMEETATVSVYQGSVFHLQFKRTATDSERKGNRWKVNGERSFLPEIPVGNFGLPYQTSRNFRKLKRTIYISTENSGIFW